MKKIAGVIIIILLGAGAALAWVNRDLLRLIITRMPDVRQVIVDSGSLVADIRRDVNTPGPLRSAVNALNANLTRPGTIRETNEQRAQNNLPPLQENELLNRVAEMKLKDMFDQQYFEHVSPKGLGPSDLVEAVEYEYVTVGENLALGNYQNDEKLVEAWMNSPGHRANILNSRFTEIGVAVGRGRFEGRMTWLAVQTFAKPASQCPQVDASLKATIDSYRAEVDALEVQVRQLKAELEAMDPKNKHEYEAYNAKVREYNQLVKLYNNKLDILKQAIPRYNEQVNAFNACVSK